MPKKLGSPRTKSHRGHRFLVQFYDDGSAVFIDSTRNYAEVARVNLPTGVQKVSPEAEAILSRAVVAIADNYRRQYKLKMYGIALLSAGELTPDEMALGVGLDDFWRQQVLKYGTMSQRVPEESQKPRRRKRSLQADK